MKVSVNANCVSAVIDSNNFLCANFETEQEAFSIGTALNLLAHETTMTTEGLMLVLDAVRSHTNTPA